MAEKMYFKFFIVLLILMLTLFSCLPGINKNTGYDYSKMPENAKEIHLVIEDFISSCVEDKYPLEISKYTRIDSIIVNENQQYIDVFLNRYFSYVPLRENEISLIYFTIRDALDSPYDEYALTIFSKNYPIQQLIPNYYRSSKDFIDISRIPSEDLRTEPIVRRINHPWKPTHGLYNRNIALWHSHGWYYEQRLNRWEWQRARLFQTVEDIGPMAFTIPYIIPMLENAGANVFVPRERDTQINEVIVDNNSENDTLNVYSEKSDTSNIWQTGTTAGFAIGNPPYSSGVNPFKLGTYRKIRADSMATAQINWIPNIPETGKYAVYISYAHSDSNVTDAHYTVFHSGGSSEFLINQQMGGGTWIFLGKFKFKSGQNPEIGKVQLSNQSNEKGKYITADAVRFGGGMGVVSRFGETSNRPKFVEAARYYLQFAGAPDTLIYNLHADTLDYNDDYKCRGEWVNYLKGNPFGPNRDRNNKGLGIPIDLSLAFHTDAGISATDTVIGTLSIYSTQDAETLFVFPDGVSRLANRDFADIMQTQIVEDLRKKWDPVWNRRGLWDRMYSEAWRPNVPAALLELLSHQNFLDVKFFHDPQYKFDVSRAIYKSMLRFIATQYQVDYVVQPLPVTHMSAEFEEENSILLSWQPQLDLLEKSAVAEKYIVYTRKNDNDFDNGVLVDQPQYRLANIDSNTIYSFKVTAVNSGGESFPSEILSACYINNSRPVLVINGFDRISSAATVETDKFTGFVDFIDAGVPDKYDINYTGTQFNYTPPSRWSDDDSPGFGASYGNFETIIIPGNTFDFCYLHGKSIKAAGYSFVSASDESVMDGNIEIQNYDIIDLILGEERSTEYPKPRDQKRFEAFPEKIKAKLDSFVNSGGNLFLSGSYIGTDLYETDQDSVNIKFAINTLKYRLRTNYAAKTGGLKIVDPSFLKNSEYFEFNTEYHPQIYTAEAPDGIEPADSLGYTFLRYTENNISAGIVYNGGYKIVAVGFPFETILGEQQRNSFMKSVLEYFKN